jgi:PAS domain S-box-containing protein
VVDLVPAEQADVLMASHRAALAGNRRHFETPGWRHPGQYWSVDVVPLRGEGGAVSGGMAFWRDITKRHRAEEALRQHRRQLQEAQQLARVGSWEWDLATDRVSWSAELYRILGVDPGAVLTRELTRELIHPDDRAMRERLLAGALSDPSPFQTEFRAVRRDGTVVWMLAHTQGVCDQAGRVVRVVGTNQDITQAKQAEQDASGCSDACIRRWRASISGWPPTCTTATCRVWPPLACGWTRPLCGWTGARPAPSGGCSAACGSRSATSWPRCGAPSPRCVRWCWTRAAWPRPWLSWPPPPATGLTLRPATSPWTLDGAPLDPVVETALFRVAQQALANVEQHANARHLRVALCRDGPQVVLVVEDDGCGFDPTHTQAVADTHGFGLTCMRERLQAIGGQFTLRSAPGAGTRIQAQVAVQAPP